MFSLPEFSFTAYPSSSLTVFTGAHEGDAIGLLDDVVPGDIYRLSRSASPVALRIRDGVTDPGRKIVEQQVAAGSEVGAPGDAVTLDLCHTLMAPDGTILEILVLTLHMAAGPARYLLPLTAIKVATDYELVTSEPDSAPRRFADITCASLLAGTHISLASGKLVPVEDLQVGDLVLTRHNGPQPVRWIGRETARATGALAPVRITGGTLNALRDLRLSPHHRLFIWQRTGTFGDGRSEVMVKAGYLVNGTTVLREAGGHVDTFHLVFDRHEIIFAEGIAVESPLVMGQTRAALPADLRLASGDADLLNAAQIEVPQSALGGKGDPVARLTRASRGLSDPG